MAQPRPLKPLKALKPPEPIRWWVLAPLFALVLLFLPVPGWVVEELYSRDTYPWLQGVLTAATNAMPFALLDVLIFFGVIAVGHRAIRLINVTQQRGILDALWEAIRRVIRATAILVILFCWAWGFNYRRTPLEQGLPGRQAVRPTAESLTMAVVEANALAARLRTGVHAGRELTYEDVADDLLEPMNAALKKVGRPPLARGGRPKYSYALTPFFTSAGVTGMINPLGLESVVHPELLPYERPFVLAHEWAHLSGQADEAEASAVGWLACMLSDPPFAYSASLYLILEAGGALPADARAAAWGRLDPGVRRDIDAIAARMRRESPSVQRTATRIYSEYLRANRVADGAASYGRALSLILSPPLRDALSTYDATTR